MRHILLALLRAPSVVNNVNRLPTWSVTNSLFNPFISRSAATATVAKAKIKENSSPEEERKTTTDKEIRTVQTTASSTDGSSTETSKAKKDRKSKEKSTLETETSDVETTKDVSQAQQESSQSVRSGEKLSPPRTTGEEKVYSSKIQHLVNEISKLSLVDVMDLSELLKKTLKIQDVAIMASGTAAAASPIAKKEEEEEEARPSAQSVFKVRLIKYDDTKKVPVIKQVKDVVENINLVQAKKMVEAVPQVLRDNLSKADAETIKAKIEAVGGICVIE
ncbi:unnamed protein product [Didymodactylos carnosus]|uniref:Uncharacterized protein n=1 Tax=Didymodactylos carnosus TaxID=1234261 RepID=A0A813UA46_9BILA|nr:unnamed protein product [Didymodactylos carnosus]CAF0942315.1 unnamed protein product [Didymodactylos carnosus]CAF3610354.1 unnamed protein product [Didymodactylos carnosus]CAF3717289.1 unnamed protein product [Didymodactylos carnosus]